MKYQVLFLLLLCVASWKRGETQSTSDEKAKDMLAPYDTGFIYVYDLPSKFNSDLVPMPDGAWHIKTYDADVQFHNLLLKSKARTLDPKAARLFFVPVYSTRILHHTWGLILKEGSFKHEEGWLHAVNLTRRFVESAHPYLKYWEGDGENHIIPMTHDRGRCLWDSPSEAPMKLRGAISLQISGESFCLKPHDIIVPPLIDKQRFAQLGFNHPTSPEKRNKLAVFRGSINYNDFQAPARVAILKSYAQDKDVIIYTEKTNDIKVYANEMKSSKFCFTPPGVGLWTSRFYDAIAAGCIPVVFPDPNRHNTNPFESKLHYDLFTLEVPWSDIPQAKEKMQSVVNSDQLEVMQRHLLVAARMLNWHDAGFYGAFETTIQLFHHVAQQIAMKSKPITNIKTHQISSPSSDKCIDIFVVGTTKGGSSYAAHTLSNEAIIEGPSFGPWHENNELMWCTPYLRDIYCNHPKQCSCGLTPDLTNDQSSSSSSSSVDTTTFANEREQGYLDSCGTSACWNKNMVETRYRLKPRKDALYLAKNPDAIFFPHLGSLIMPRAASCNSKVLLVLRDPVARLRSHYSWYNLVLKLTPAGLMIDDFASWFNDASSLVPMSLASTTLSQKEHVRIWKEFVYGFEENPAALAVRSRYCGGQSQALKYPDICAHAQRPCTPFNSSWTHDSHSFVRGVAQSVYYPQLLSWVIDQPFARNPDNFLVIQNEHLTRDMSKVINWIGIEKSAYGTGESKLDVRDHTSGVKEPLDPALDAKIHQFFEPFNQRLEELLLEMGQPPLDFAAWAI